MANKEHLKILKKGVEAWNAWRGRTENRDIRPDLNEADLSLAVLRGINLYRSDLIKTNLHGADLRDANLFWVDLRRADLVNANLSAAFVVYADLRRANLSGADLRRAYFGQTTLNRAKLFGTDLTWTHFDNSALDGADVDEAKLRATVFANMDLRTVKGLETVIHTGPSTIGIDTLYRSRDHIPEAFLRGAGLPEEFITQIPSLIASVKPIQFQSCFISYSHRDEEFAKRLHAAMRAENLRVWFAPEDMKGGRKLHEEIFRAIQVHDKLLLVLSEQSMKSEWVMTEIRRAKKVEREENRRKLFPIRLVDFETIQSWEYFDADSGKDLAAEVREYYIPDFSNWKDHDSFEREFAKLLRDLKAT